MDDKSNNIIFSKDIKNIAGGFIITDYIDNQQVILLGKTNISNNYIQFEGFGGKSEKQDLTSLHTALRELIEEFFNIKISITKINKLALFFRINKLIIKQYHMNGMCYVINFNGLNYIFQKIKKHNTLKKYNINNYFDYETYINERIITDKPKDGLNEITSLKIFTLLDIKNNKVNLRWFTKKIISIIF
jgi:hypothetical protein